MNWLDQALVSPFVEFSFMRHSLAACLALALGCGPVGTLLVLRRMSLTGEALSHAVLPGAALGFVLSGLSLTAMTVGGFLAGLLVAAIATATLLTLAVIYRPLVVECCDPGFLRVVGGGGSLIHLIFTVLVALNLVGGFRALGTLMSVGLLTLPAAASRFWAGQVWSMALVAVGIATVSGYLGLVASYHFSLPSGPAIVLTAGLLYVCSLCLGPRQSLWAQRAFLRHLQG